MPAMAVARMPESLDPVEAAPLMCAGLTTFNALRHSGALPSDLVAVQGVGGLGHLGIQFAQKLGYRVAAVGRGPDNAALARSLGAHVYIDSAATDAAKELQTLGGAKHFLDANLHERLDVEAREILRLFRGPDPFGCTEQQHRDRASRSDLPPEVRRVHRHHEFLDTPIPCAAIALRIVSTLSDSALRCFQRGWASLPLTLTLANIGKVTS